MSGHNTEPDERQPTLLDKWRTVLSATTDDRLSRNDLCVLAQLLDYANNQTWIAWPSKDTLAANISATRRGTVNSVQNLVRHGYIEIVSAGGGRHRSSRYRPVPRAYTRPAETVAAETVKPISLKPETVKPISLKPASKNCEISCSKTVKPISPELLYDPGDKPGEIKNCEAAPDALGADAPALGAERNGELRYPAFWDAWGDRRDVYKTEQAIAELLNAGETTMAAIVDGVKRYGEYCDDNGKGKLIPPLKWIQGRRWLDSWGTKPKPVVKRFDDRIEVHETADAKLALTRQYATASVALDKALDEAMKFEDSDPDEFHRLDHKANDAFERDRGDVWANDGLRLENVGLAWQEQWLADRGYDFSDLESINTRGAKQYEAMVKELGGELEYVEKDTGLPVLYFDEDGNVLKEAIMTLESEAAEAAKS